MTAGPEWWWYSVPALGVLGGVLITVAAQAVTSAAQWRNERETRFFDERRAAYSNFVAFARKARRGWAQLTKVQAEIEKVQQDIAKLSDGVQRVGDAHQRIASEIASAEGSLSKIRRFIDEGDTDAAERRLNEVESTIGERLDRSLVILDSLDDAGSESAGRLQSLNTKLETMVQEVNSWQVEIEAIASVVAFLGTKPVMQAAETVMTAVNDRADDQEYSKSEAKFIMAVRNEFGV
jgi:septal ring factor EnvC (AmiA/AmiB activator)